MRKQIIKIITILNLVNMLILPHIYAKYVIEESVVAVEIQIYSEQEI